MSPKDTHLLGRRPSPYDARDFSYDRLLSGDPLDQAYAALLASRAAKATKAWASAVMPYLQTQPPPPPPTPAAGNVWPDTEDVLDQGKTGHCVGFGGAQWGNTLPVDDHFGDADAHALYYECKLIDGEPGQEDGSTVRSLAKALVKRGRIKAYAFASGMPAIQQFVTDSGPVVIGSDWTNDMFSPDANGYVRPTGAVAGGHCYVLDGYFPAVEEFSFLNSWGQGWGAHGRFYMAVADFAQLFASNGEALVALELP